MEDFRLSTGPLGALCGGFVIFGGLVRQGTSS